MGNPNTVDNFEAPFLDLNLSITNGIVSSKIYGKRDDFNFEIVNFPLSWWRCSSLSFLWCIYFSARVCSNVDDFNNRNLFFTAISRGTKVAYRAKTHIFCTRKVYGWNFV